MDQLLETFCSTDVGFYSYHNLHVGNQFLRIAPTNPLQLEEVLLNLCSLLDHRTLAAARLVNHQWNKSASSRFRRKSQIAFGALSKTEEEDFLTHLIKNSNDDVPVPSMRLILPRAPLSTLHKQVLSTYGQCLTSLEISAVQFQNEIGFAEMFTVLLDAVIVKWCPNLRNLKLSHVDSLQFVMYPHSSFARERTLHQHLKSFKFSIGNYPMSETSRIFITSIFTRVLERAPKLEDLELCVPNHKELLNQSLFAVYQRIHERRWTSLKSLELSNERMFSSSIEVLNNTSYRNLTYLRINASIVRQNPINQLEAFLRNLAEHLETLILDKFKASDTTIFENQSSYDFHSQCGPVPLKFCNIMNALKCFENCAPELFHTGDISFTKQMPNLEVLVLNSSYELTNQKLIHWGLWNTLMFEKPEFYFIDSVHTLRIGGVFHPTVENLKAFDRMIDHFPNLKVFHTSFRGSGDGSSFMCFMRTLTKLRKLKSLSLELRYTQEASQQNICTNTTELSFQEALETYLPGLPNLSEFKIIFEEPYYRPASSPITFEFFEKVFCRPELSLTSVTLNGFQEIPEQRSQIIQFLRENTGIYELNFNHKVYRL